MLRRFHPAMFAVTLVCFLLPFAVVSCDESTADTTSFPGETGESGAGERSEMSFRGIDLVFGKGYPESGGFAQIFEGLAIPTTGRRWPPESFAVIAALAALAGLLVTAFGPAARRAFLGTLAAATGTLSMLVLYLSPTLRSMGLLKVEWKPGYWATAFAFVLSLALSIRLLREERETHRIPPPPTTPPQGPRA